MSELEKTEKLHWVDKAALELKSPVVAISFLISLIAAIPTFYGWLYPADPLRLLTHHDLYVVYDPGRPVGVRTHIGLPPGSEFRPLRPTTLPNPPIRILSLSGEEITSPILDIEVSIWNGGSEPINRDKIRRPLTLTIPNANSLHGFQVLHQNPNDGLTIKVNETTPASLDVSWDYLDPGKGFKFAVVFATSERLLQPIQFNGYITANIIDTNREIPGISWRNAITTIALAVSFGLLLVAIMRRVRFLNKILAITIPLYIVGITVYLTTFLTRAPVPPF